MLSVAWVAAGRANAFYSGLGERDCPKAWDWCAAAIQPYPCPGPYPYPYPCPYPYPYPYP